MSLLTVRDKYDNEPLSHWLETTDWNLQQDDGHMLFVIKETGVDSYGFYGEDLKEFLRLALTAIYDYGGVPIIWNNEQQKFNILFPKSMDKTEQIIKIVERWGSNLEKIKEEVWLVHEDKLNKWLTHNPQR